MSDFASKIPSLTNTLQIYALGNGTDVLGMNSKLLPWLQARKGKRFGIISRFSYLLYCTADGNNHFPVLDFYDAVPGLVEAVIGL